MSGCNITPGEIKKALLEKALPIAKSFDSSFSITRAGEIFLPVSSSVQYKDAPYKLKRIIDKAISGIYRELGIDKKKFRYTFGYQQYNDGAAIQVTVSPSLLKAYQVKNNEKSLEQAFPNAPTQLDMFSQGTDKSEIAIEDFLPPLSPSKKLTQPTFDVEQGIEKRSSSEFVYEGEVYPSYADALAAQKEDSYEEEDYTLSKESPSTEINPGVEELFDLNPELANQVYEALVPIGYTRLYRAENEKGVDSPAPNWLLEQPEVKAQQEAQGRWFYRSYEEAKYHSEKFGSSGITYIDVPTNQVESFNAKDNKFGGGYAKDGKEYFVTKELANNKKSFEQQKQQALQLYSQHLDTVFPDRKVKDVLYHGTDLDKNDVTFKSDRGGIFLASTLVYASYFSESENVYPVLVNFKNTYEAKGLTDNIGKKEVEIIKSRGYDSVIGKGGISKMQQHQNDLEYIAFKPEQIYPLGTKQDIERFKEFVGSVSNVQEAQPIIPINEMEDIIDNLPPFTKDIEDLGFTEEACDL